MLPLARHEAQLALQLDPLLAEAHASLGVAAMFFAWDWAEAERRITKALALDDRSVTAHVYHSLWLTCRGRVYDALEAARRAEHLDPMSLLAMSSVAWSLLHTGDIEGAEAHLHRMLAIAPEFPDALALLAHIAEGRRDIDQAIAYTRRWLPQVGLPAEAADQLRDAQATGGWPAYWRRYLDVLQGQQGQAGAASTVLAATLYTLLGEPEAALDQLEHARDAHAPMLAFVGADMRLSTLRGHPRFARLLADIGVA